MEKSPQLTPRFSQAVDYSRQSSRQPSQGDSSAVYGAPVGCRRARAMQAFAHYAAMSDLNVWAGRTSNCFRGALTGIAFGQGFDLCGSRSGRGGRASTSGQGSLALTLEMAGILGSS
jgi:hypothetical protein